MQMRRHLRTITQTTRRFPDALVRIGVVKSIVNKLRVQYPIFPSRSNYNLLPRILQICPANEIGEEEGALVS